MQGIKKRISKHRIFTEEFKRMIVGDFERGSYSVSELSRLHGLSSQTIYNWIYKYSHVNERGYRVVEMKESSTEKVKQLELKVRELERMVGQKQIRIDFLERMIDLAGEELGMDIKKKCSTPQSPGSGSMEKNGGTP